MASVAIRQVALLGVGARDFLASDGPDSYAAFGLGLGDKTIDLDGVALVTI